SIAAQDGTTGLTKSQMVPFVPCLHTCLTYLNSGRLEIFPVQMPTIFFYLFHDTLFLVMHFQIGQILMDLAYGHGTFPHCGGHPFYGSFPHMTDRKESRYTGFQGLWFALIEYGTFDHGRLHNIGPRINEPFFVHGHDLVEPFATGSCANEGE